MNNRANTALQTHDDPFACGIQTVNAVSLPVESR